MDNRCHVFTSSLGKQLALSLLLNELLDWMVGVNASDFLVVSDQLIGYLRCHFVLHRVLLLLWGGGCSIPLRFRYILLLIFMLNSWAERHCLRLVWSDWFGLWLYWNKNEWELVNGTYCNQTHCASRAGIPPRGKAWRHLCPQLSCSILRPLFLSSLGPFWFHRCDL